MKKVNLDFKVGDLVYVKFFTGTIYDLVCREICEAIHNGELHVYNVQVSYQNDKKSFGVHPQIVKKQPVIFK